jgi:hypothetical protein
MNTIQSENWKIKRIWQAFSLEDVLSGVIVEGVSQIPFPYDDEYKPGMDAKDFFSLT